MGLAQDIAALEAAARNAVLPSDVFDYYAGGSGAEVTLDEAAGAWLRYRFAPSVLRAVPEVDPGVTLFGARLPSPVGIAPMAFQTLLHPDGEVAMALGAGDALLVVSTRATRTIEDIAAARSGPWWLQVYATRERSVIDALVLRAVGAGASALVLTGDTPYVSRKARQGRLSSLGEDEYLVNLGRHLPPGADPDVALDQSPDITDAEIARLARLSRLPVLVKGVLRADDARRCIDAGAAGLIVSTHGGRQLDRVRPSALALPEVVEAAGDVPVLVDGGIRSGHDVLVALALGARAVLVGRPFAWALADGGADGVRALAAAFTDEFAHVLALAGCRDVGAIRRDLVVPAH